MKNYLSTAIIALIVTVMFAICAIAFIIAPSQEHTTILNIIGLSGMLLVGYYGSKMILEMFAADTAAKQTADK